MSLTFSIRNNPGVYALLVGSGISKGAEIPTGGDIIEDLIEKIADAEGADIDSEPAAWYLDQYGEQPRYDDLLEQLAPSREDRQALLKPYFEPTEEERKQGIKTPSAAHENIAWLVNEGYINVVITTNFDRLLEQAFNDIGIIPTVISKPNDAKGAAPLVHDDAVILKVNGDYKASTLKNTANELDSYEAEIEDLIEQVLDEYGLIVCGWSGSWDSALRDLILSSENRRYSMFWTAHSELSEGAKELVKHRDGNIISIEGADNFFYNLKERVQALKHAEAGGPLSEEIARERTKRYLAREEYKINLADLIREETEHVRNHLINEDRFDLNTELGDEAIKERLQMYEKDIQILASIFSTCAYWGNRVPNSVEETLCKSLKRLASSGPDTRRYNSCWKKLTNYPVTILTYVVGVATIEAEDWDLINNVLVDTEAQQLRSGSKTMVEFSHPFFVGSEMIYRNNFDYMVFRIENAIREPLSEFIPDDERYKAVFGKFRMIYDMVLIDLFEDKHDREVRMETERYFDLALDGHIQELREEIEVQGETWEPIQAGLFEGSLERAETAVSRLGPEDHT